MSVLREKCPNPEFFLVLIFPGKYGPEKTPYLDTFQTVCIACVVVSFLNIIVFKAARTKLSMSYCHSAFKRRCIVYQKQI